MIRDIFCTPKYRAKQNAASAGTWLHMPGIRFPVSLFLDPRLFFDPADRIRFFVFNIFLQPFGCRLMSCHRQYGCKGLPWRRPGPSCLVPLQPSLTCGIGQPSSSKEPQEKNLENLTESDLIGDFEKRQGKSGKEDRKIYIFRNSRF